MRLRYRIPGLESDNFPYVINLTSQEIPPDQYSHIGILGLHPHGLGDLLRRLAISVHNVCDSNQSELVEVMIHILEFCLKTPECQKRLIDPQIK